MATCRLVAAVVLVACALVRPAPARAQTGHAAVDALLREAIALRQAGRDLDALPQFERAYAQGPGPITAAQLGLVLQALGRWAAAEPYLREALDAASDPWIARRRATLERAYATNQQHVGRLEVLGGIDGAQVRIDGAPAGRMPLARPIAVPAGTVTLEVEAPGCYVVTRQVQVAAGAVTREAIELRPLASTSPAEPTTTTGTTTTAPPVATSTAATTTTTPPPPATAAPVPHPPPREARAPLARPLPRVVVPAARRWSARLEAGAVAATAGIAFIAAGVAGSVVHENIAADFNRPMHCPNPGWMDVPVCASEYRDATLAQGLAAAAYVIGGAAVVAGVALIVWPRTEPHGAGSGRAPAGHAGIGCAPSLVAPGVQCAGVF